MGGYTIFWAEWEWSEKVMSFLQSYPPANKQEVSCLVIGWKASFTPHIDKNLVGVKLAVVWMQTMGEKEAFPFLLGVRGEEATWEDT